MLVCLAADHDISDRKLLYLLIADIVLQLPFLDRHRACEENFARDCDINLIAKEWCMYDAIICRYARVTRKEYMKKPLPLLAFFLFSFSCSILSSASFFPNLPDFLQ